MKQGQEPAFPVIEEIQGNYGKYWQTTVGMSKRFYAACAAMQGMLGNGRYSDTELDNTIPDVIKICYRVADELLKQEKL